MDKKFGTFRTIEELNRAAAAQKAEGDYEALKALALENGLDKEDAEDYFDLDIDKLCTPFMAAVAKLNQEAEELDIKSQLSDWKNIIVEMCEKSDPLCEAVFSPDKTLIQILAKALKTCSSSRIMVNPKIIKAAGLPESAAQIGMIGRDDFKKLVTDYYLGKTAK